MSEFTIHVDQESFKVQQEDLSSLDLHKTSAANFHLLQGHKSYKVELLAKNMLAKTMTLRVNGNTYKVKIDDQYDTMVAQMGLLEKTEAKSNNVIAPMPGYIVDIMVRAGDTVEKDTPLFVLSAMKMENVILSDGAGVVKTVTAQKDEAVDKGQLIIEMESE